MKNNDVKPLALSIAQAARAWSVSRGTAYSIIKQNPWIRVIQVYGSKRAIVYEDVEKYIARCKTVGVSSDADSAKMVSVNAAASAAHARKGKKPPAAAPAEPHNAESAA
jgi:hypothetical protein